MSKHLMPTNRIDLENRATLIAEASAEALRLVKPEALPVVV